MEPSYPVLAGAAQLRVSLLGAMAVHAGATPLQLPTRKAQALLAYLALRPGKPHEREKLQALLWPEAGRAQAQGSLRQALLTIRSLFIEHSPAVLRTHGSCVALDDARVQVDVMDFERCAAGSTLETLEEAQRLYGGPLLEGLNVADSAFEEWVALERARLQELAVGALEKLAELQARAGQIDQAIQTGLHSLRIEPLQERTHRSLMRLYALHGRRAEAMQQYATCAAWLKRELGVEPEGQTLRLYQELQREPQREIAAAPAGAPASPKTRIIGRRTELGRLEQALDAAWSGSGQLVVLRGEAGVGKTRLLEAVASHVAGRGGVSMRGRCYESEQVLPLALWVDLVRNQPKAAEASLECVPGARRAELRRALRIGDDGLGAASNPAVDARALFEATSALFRQIASQAPLLVVLEDLHWSDAMSMRLLSYFARHIEPSSRLCVMASVRAEDMSAAPLLRTVLHEIDRSQRVITLDVEPLSREDTSELIRVLAPELTDGSAVERLWSMSEGNPLVLVEALHEQAPASVATELAHLPVPMRIKELIAGYVDQLDQAGRDALAAAAVIGRAFSFALLARGSGTSEEQTAEVVEVLVRKRLLQVAGDDFYFSHDRIREVVLESLLPVRRRMLSRSIARALVELCADWLDVMSGPIGYHFAAAGDSVESVHYLLRFARHSIPRAGVEGAHLALQECERQIDELPAARRPAVALEIATLRSMCFLFQGRIGEMADVLAPHKATAESVGDSALALSFAFMSAFTAARAGHYERALEHEARALAMLELSPDSSAAGEGLAVLCSEARERGEHRRALGLGLAAVAKLETTHALASFVHIDLAGIYLAMGDWRASLDSTTRAAEAARRMGARDAEGLSLGFEGLLRGVMLGEHAAGLAACVRGMSLASNPVTSLSTHFLFLHVSQFIASIPGGLGPAILDDRFRAAIGTVEALLASDGFARSQVAVDPLVTLSDCCLLRGDTDRATEHTQRALALCAHDYPPRAHACHAMARIELARQLPASARQWLSEARRIYSLCDMPLDLALLDVFVSYAEHLLGNGEAAVRHSEDAHRTFEALDLPYWSDLLRTLAALSMNP